MRPRMVALAANGRAWEIRDSVQAQFQERSPPVILVVRSYGEGGQQQK